MKSAFRILFTWVTSITALGLFVATLKILRYRRDEVPHVVQENGGAATALTTSTQINISDLAPPTIETEPDLSSAVSEPLELPPEYNYVRPQSEYCKSRFTPKYLDLLRQGLVQYCSNNSSSQLACFHTPKGFHDDGHRDNFCIAQDVGFDSSAQRFSLRCHNAEEGPDFVSMGHLQEYWYETGVRPIIASFFKFFGYKTSTAEDVKYHGQEQRDEVGKRELEPTSGSGDVRQQETRDNIQPDFYLLVKREGAANVYHCMAQLLSMTYTFDILRMTRDRNTQQSYYKFPEDVSNTQVIILDDHPDGPFFDLWRLFSGRTPKRLQQLSEEENSAWQSGRLANVIIPLAGGANPIWHRNWEKHECTNELRDTFVRRVLDFYHIPYDDDPFPGPDVTLSQRLMITFVDRKQSRFLKDSDRLLDLVRARYPDLEVQAIDWGTMPFRDQILLARKTDILVGIHGAGLTQTMFMKQGKGALVEILPESYNNGYRAMALERGLKYYRAHGTVVEQKEDWHVEDLEIEEGRFLELIDHAVKSLYNRPGWFRDLN